ncbi:LOW QUALITY PROTEIN: E3 ubiquitin-protein ligase TRIM11-like [Macrotis lagotis]|uniref:LOW QUALITY PROTEIN: E3 ubiquitin-protein ligase TRIM11-like n=1 Tax=Macrotis lagotis TaxID=92651 RepID=UPI003D688C04
MASCPESVEDLQKEVTCPICMDFFTKPVSIQCGHSFCHSCLLRSWQQASTLLCPECRSVSQQREYKANVRLGKLADILKKLRPSGLCNPEGHGKCEVHQKVKKLFCEDDQSLICVSCSQSQEHETHSLCCTDEAAENCRGKLQETVTSLWKKSEVVARQLKYEKTKFSLLEMEIDIQKKNILSEFHKFIQLLHEEKDAYLSNLQTEGRSTLERQNRRISELTEQSQELREKITELEEECKKPDLDLLQDVKGLFKKNELVLQKGTEPVHTSIPICSIPGLMEWIFSLKVDITLDCTTADHGLIITEDLKSVRYGGVQEEIPNNSWGPIGFAQVLGTQSFTSGKYYWEVEVPNNTAWCVGFCNKSKDFQNSFVLSNRQVNNSFYLFAGAQHSLYSHVQYRQASVLDLKVGIFLDYEHGEISFYHVKKRYLIYTFPTTSFSGQFLPFFSLSKTKDCSLTICS